MAARGNVAFPEQSQCLELAHRRNPNGAWAVVRDNEKLEGCGHCPAARGMAPPCSVRKRVRA